VQIRRSMVTNPMDTDPTLIDIQLQDVPIYIF